jgi:hypothetical protein
MYIECTFRLHFYVLTMYTKCTFHTHVFESVMYISSSFNVHLHVHSMYIYVYISSSFNVHLHVHSMYIYVYISSSFTCTFRLHSMYYVLRMYIKRPFSAHDFAPLMYIMPTLLCMRNVYKLYMNCTLNVHWIVPKMNIFCTLNVTSMYMYCSLNRLCRTMIKTLGDLPKITNGPLCLLTRRKTS